MSATGRVLTFNFVIAIVNGIGVRRIDSLLTFLSQSHLYRSRPEEIHKGVYPKHIAHASGHKPDQIVDAPVVRKYLCAIWRRKAQKEAIRQVIDNVNS